MDFFVSVQALIQMHKNGFMHGNIYSYLNNNLTNIINISLQACCQACVAGEVKLSQESCGTKSKSFSDIMLLQSNG